MVKLLFLCRVHFTHEIDVSYTVTLCIDICKRAGLNDFPNISHESPETHGNNGNNGRSSFIWANFRSTLKGDV